MINIAYAPRFRLSELLKIVMVDFDYYRGTFLTGGMFTVTLVTISWNKEKCCFMLTDSVDFKSVYNVTLQISQSLTLLKIAVGTDRKESS